MDLTYQKLKDIEIKRIKSMGYLCTSKENVTINKREKKKKE